jgi:hypothetical protein
MAADNDYDNIALNFLLPPETSSLQVLQLDSQQNEPWETRVRYSAVPIELREDGASHALTAAPHPASRRHEGNGISDIGRSSTIQETESIKDAAFPDGRPATPAALKRYQWLSNTLPSAFYQWLTDTWWPEALGLLLSASCLTAIGGLLLPYTFSHRQVPEFSRSLTLNTLVSILAAAAKSALLFSVASTMGQAKWCWFRPAGGSTRRRLQDIQTLDDASRGPMGSVLALCSETLMSVCSVGAVITILALAFDPFLQQLLTYPSETTIISTDATTLTAPILGPGLSGNPDIYSWMLTGLYGGKKSYSRTPYCPSGNCTWPLFDSVGWCGTCGQTPLQYESNTCNLPWEEYSLSQQNLTVKCELALAGAANKSVAMEVDMDDKGGALFNMVFPATWLLISNTMNASTFAGFEQYLDNGSEFLGYKTPMTAFATATPGPYTGNFTVPISDWLEGQTCIFTPCSRTYNISVQDGQVQETVVNEDWGSLVRPPPGLGSEITFCWKPTDAPIGEFTYDIVNGNPINGTFRSWCGYSSFEYQAEFAQVFQGTMSFSSGYRWFSTSNLTEIPPPETFGQSSELLEHVFWDTPGGLKSLMPSVLESLTYGALQALHSDQVKAPELQTSSRGTVLAERPFVHVRWRWMTLPVILEVMGLIFLVVTVRTTGRLNLPLWKSSAIVMLYHGLDQNLVERGESYERASVMADTARGIYVRLDPNDAH